MATPRVTQLRRQLSGATDVDGVARAVLETLLDLPEVVRAGIALVAPGGRQHHFLPSDPERLHQQPEWCLIDAYADLPLNDCIRTGRAVCHRTPETLAQAYPVLAAAQAGTAIRSAIAVPINDGERRLGGLLMYADVDLIEHGEPGPELAALLAEVVADALLAVRPYDEWPAAEGHLLPADETAPSVARHWLLESLVDVPLDEAALDAALVCTSELVTNIVMHTGRPSVASLERLEGAVVFRLHHLADPAPRLVRNEVDTSDPMRISGHGLELVEALSDGWGTEDHDGITTIWCRLRM